MRTPAVCPGREAIYRRRFAGQVAGGSRDRVTSAERDEVRELLKRTAVAL
jgi:hypothetical protein